MQRATEVHERLDGSVRKRATGDLIALSDRLPAAAVRVLAQEVVQRLAGRLPAAETVGRHARWEDIEALCMALISVDDGIAARLVDELRQEGASIDEVYLVHLAGAARLLGEWWLSDRVSFLEVTLGTSRIVAILRRLRSAFVTSDAGNLRTAVFASVPGEQHTLGISMAADLFRREGWDVSLKLGHTHEELVNVFELEQFSVVGLSAHGAKSLAALIRLVLAIRVCRPAASVLVSGHIVEEADDIIALTGADAIASDISGALREMRRLGTLSKTADAGAL